MRQVWKYLCQDIGQEFILPMPVGSVVGHFDVQDGHLYFWALVDPEMSTRDRTFLVSGTGHQVPENWVYIATVLTNDGALVWHLGEII